MNRRILLLLLVAFLAVPGIWAAQADPSPSADSHDQPAATSPSTVLSPQCITVSLDVFRPTEPSLLAADFHTDVSQTLARAATAYQARLAVIADNLANVETVAFKRARLNLESVSDGPHQRPTTEDTGGHFAPLGMAIGTGVRAAGVQVDFRQGALQETGVELDVAIEGPGFFQVTDPSGHTLYTRAGSFSLNANGDFAVGSADVCRLLHPPINIPIDTTAVVISPEGIVSIRLPGNQPLAHVGQIELATFVNPQGLLRHSGNLYGGTDASGAPTLAFPGQDSFGLLHQGRLEASNVDPNHEQIDWDRTATMLKRIREMLDLQ